MMLCIVTAQAQTVGVAVLTHGDAKTMFYGNTALLQAVEAATEGDVISLSPGTFHGFNNFSKSGLTIIGSGMDEGPSQTILTEFSVRAKNNEEKFVKLALKNLYIPRSFNCDRDGNYKLSFEKCWFSSGMLCDVEENNKSIIEINNCYTGDYNTTYDCNDHFANCSVSAHNSVLKPVANGDVPITRIFKNCVLLCNPAGLMSIENCIIHAKDVCRLPADVRATNCKALVYLNDYFGTQTLTNTCYDIDFDAFVEGSFYELKPELASEWVDENGEQIGIYGGPEPFSAIPNAPRFTKFNVPTKTDVDGKLPVEIEIAMPAK